MWVDRRIRAAAAAAALVLTAGPSTHATAQGEPAKPKTRGAVAEALQPFVDRHELAGAVTLVADKEKVLAVETVGYADVAAKRPMAADALFWIASQSKPMTAAALMMLADEGKVRLDDPVETYLPEFRGLWLAAEQDQDHALLKRPAHKITVREILSHTSGLPFKSALETPTLDGLPLAVAVRSYAMTPLLFEPGSKYLYSNAGINTAGRIVEVVSGLPYEEFMRTRLFVPLGMTDTTFRPDAARLKRLAKAYKPDRAKSGLEETTVTQLSSPLDDPARQPVPAGGLFSTAADVSRFCQMMLNHGTFRGKRILSEDAVSALTTKQTPDPVKDQYGLGFATGGGTFGHGGAYATNMTVDPKRGLIFIFLVQHAGFPGEGSKSQAAFRKAAADAYADSARRE